MLKVARMPWRATANWCLHQDRRTPLCGLVPPTVAFVVAFVLVGLLFGHPAKLRAAIIGGSYSGVVTSAVAFGGANVPGNISAGDIVSGTFSYDTSTFNAQEVFVGDGAGFRYSFVELNPKNFFRVEIGGQTFSTDPSNVDFFVTVIDGTTSDNHDQFSVFARGTNGGFPGSSSFNSSTFLLQHFDPAGGGPGFLRGTNLPTRLRDLDLDAVTGGGAPSVVPGIVPANIIATTGPGGRGYQINYDVDLDTFDLERKFLDTLETSKLMQFTQYYTGFLRTRYPFYLASFSILAPACPLTATATCVALAAGASAAAFYEVYQMSQIVRDPPDPNFTEIFVPTTYDPITIDPALGISDNLLSSANDMFEASAEFFSLLEAWLVTLERLQAAELAGDQSAAQAQENALIEYISATSQKASELGVLHEKFFVLLEQLVGPIVVSSSDVQNALNNLATNGLDQNILDILSTFGLSDADVEELISEIFAANPIAVSDNLFSQTSIASGDYLEFAEFTDCVSGSCIATVDEAPTIAIFTSGMIGTFLIVIWRRRAARGSS